MIKRIHMTKWLVIRVLIVVGTVFFCLSVWPWYGIHTYQTESRYPYDISQTSWLSAGDVVCQYFSPTHSWLDQVMLAVSFDESTAADNYLIFTLWDVDGQEICVKEINLEQIENNKYFSVPIRKKLQSGHEYAWSLTLPETTNLQYAVLNTGDVIGNAQESIALLVNGEDIQRNAVSQYVYYAHYDKAEITGNFWCGALVICLLLLELTDRAERKEVCKSGDIDRKTKEI